MALSYEAFYLGNASLVDVTEGNDTAERASLLVGQSFGQADDPLASHVVTFAGINRGGLSGVLDTNNRNANDLVAITDGDDTINYTFDAGVAYVATLTYVDGTVVTGVTVATAQMTNGDLYIVPSRPDLEANSALLAAPLRSVTFTSVAQNTYSGLNIDRPAADFPTCFHVGTLIDTPDGPRSVERIAAGDLVTTLDRGPRPVLWTGGHAYDAAEAAARPKLRPIRIAAGSLGPGQPVRDLLVSPQHRILLTGALAARVSDAPAVLVAAGRLTGLPGIARVPEGRAVGYRHLLFDRHELIRAEGLVTESMLCGPMAMRALAPADRAAILALLPEASAAVPVRPIVSGRDARRLAEGAALPVEVRARRSRAG